MRRSFFVGLTALTAVSTKADADGYTLLVHSSAHTITPAIYQNLSYDVMACGWIAITPTGAADTRISVHTECNIWFVKRSQVARRPDGDRL